MLNDAVLGLTKILKSFIPQRSLVNAAPTDHISYEEIRHAVDEALSQAGGEIMPAVVDSLREQDRQEGILQSAWLDPVGQKILDIQIKKRLNSDILP